MVHRRLRRVLAAAYRNVPHYRKVMRQAGYDPVTGYSGPQDLKRLPVLTKRDLQSLLTGMTM